MKKRKRLAIFFALITVIALLLVAAVVYFSAKKNREAEFYSLLKKEAITKANFFLNTNSDKKGLQDINHSNHKIHNEIAIYDTSFVLLYHDAEDIDFVKESRSMINEIYKKGEIKFYQQHWQAIGLRYEFEGKIFIITAAAYDQYGHNELNKLLINSIIIFVVFMLFILIAGVFFSRKAFKTDSEVIEKAKNISAINLDLRPSNKGSKDELSEMENLFNGMLNRLKNSFASQKHFVSNVSHELRTSLAAIITELELSINNDRNNEEYRMTIENALRGSKEIVQLSNSLLDLAKASYDPSEIAFRNIRIDEILLDARQQVQRTNPEYIIYMHFANDIENDNNISVSGNEYLLKVAFCNLFENGCKFSSLQKCIVSVSFDTSNIILKFKDTGIGIPEKDIQHIYTPFYRGENKEHAHGHGIGLPLTKKIVTLHKGQISVRTQENIGTTFIIVLPHLQ